MCIHTPTFCRRSNRRLNSFRVPIEYTNYQHEVVSIAFQIRVNAICCPLICVFLISPLFLLHVDCNMMFKISSIEPGRWHSQELDGG